MFVVLRILQPVGPPTATQQWTSEGYSVKCLDWNIVRVCAAFWCLLRARWFCPLLSVSEFDTRTHSHGQVKSKSYFRHCKCDAHLSESVWTGTSVKMEANLCVLYWERVLFTVHQINFSFVKGTMCQFFMASRFCAHSKWCSLVSEVLDSGCKGF